MVYSFSFSSAKPFFVAGKRPISHRVGRSVRRSVGLSHFAFFAFLGSLRVENFVSVHAPAQIITAPAQIIIAPAQPSATGAVVYTALFKFQYILTLSLCSIDAG